MGALCRVPRVRPRAIIGLLPSVCRQIEAEEYYRVYVCESLHLAPQNRYLTARYADILKPPKAEDNRKPQEVLADIAMKAGLTINESL